MVIFLYLHGQNLILKNSNYPAYQVVIKCISSDRRMNPFKQIVFFFNIFEIFHDVVVSTVEQGTFQNFTEVTVDGNI